MTPPLVSIITVVFNNRRFIESAIRSVLEQRHPAIEYIVIDGGSQDGTVEIIRAYGNRIAKVISEPDKGIYDAMNKGLKMATGEIVGILNSDDVYMDADVIATVAETMEREKAEAAWGDLVIVDRENERKVTRAWKSSPYEKGKFARGWHPPHPTFFVRRHVYERYGYFDLRFAAVAADYEIMLRFLERYGVRSCYIPRVLVRMRGGGNSTKNILQIFRGNIECYKSFKANGLRASPLFIIIKPLSKIIQLVRARLLG